MSYQTQNELEHFIFEEAVVQDFRPSPGGFTLLLDNVRILPENSTNRDIRTMRCNEMTLKIEGGTIRGLFEEAYRLYDADFHLVQELPERQCPPEEWEKLLKMLSGGDSAALGSAAKQAAAGDMSALSAMLQRVLNTPEGAALAARVEESLQR